MLGALTPAQIIAQPNETKRADVSEIVTHLNESMNSFNKQSEPSCIVSHSL